MGLIVIASIGSAGIGAIGAWLASLGISARRQWNAERLASLPCRGCDDMSCPCNEWM